MKEKSARGFRLPFLSDIRMVRRLISIGLVVVLAIVFSLTTNAFLGSRNLSVLLRDSAYLGLMALGMAFTIIGGGIDLSVGGIVCFVGLVCIRLAATGVPGIIVLLGGVASGVICGAINAMFIVKVRLTEFVATLASGFAFSGMTLVFAYREGGVIVTPRTVNESYRFFRGSIGGISYNTVIWIILTVVALFILTYTSFGMHTYAIGSHQKSARMSGVNNDRVKAFGYLISGGCAGLAAVLQVAIVGAAPVNIGTGYEFQAIAACVVGGVALGGGKGDAISAFVGSLFMAMLVNGLLKFGISTSTEYIMQGVIIIIATAFDALFNRISAKRLLVKTREVAGMLDKKEEKRIKKEDFSELSSSLHEDNSGVNESLSEGSSNKAERVPQSVSLDHSGDLGDEGEDSYRPIYDYEGEIPSGIFLEVKSVFKQFSGVEVLHGVDLDVNYGEVHALMGENGAGKSTIIKIITGVFAKDAGDIYINGEIVEISNRQDSSALGIQVIYQELSLIPALSVTENIFLGQEQTKSGILNKKAMRQRVQSLIEHYGFEIDPDEIIQSMSMAQRQMAEILKALAFRAKLIIMDEPTSSLSASESEKLFETIETLRKRGVGILYISHRLEEVYRLSDRLTVMRDGNIVGVLKKGEIDSRTVTTMMIGHEVGNEEQKWSTRRHEENCLEVENLSYSHMLKDVSFKAYGGEILGIGGLVGSGRTELIRCIFGAEKRSGGAIRLNGKPVSRKIKKNIKVGFGYVPEDRRVEGLVPQLSMERNITIASYDRLTSVGLVSRKKEIDWAERTIKNYDIRPPLRNLTAINLSGGNQQKVILGRWLSRDPQLLLLDEPTVGVDVGVKRDLYKLLRELADTGTIVVMVSSDIAELVYLSDRILVMRDGRFFEEFTRGNATQEAILLAASGIHTEEGVAL